MRFLLMILLLLPVQASALEVCDDLWFTRNLMFDRAGHCFGSALGKSIFDNAGCTAAGVTLDKNAAALVTLVREIEAEWSCKTDTSRRVLAVPMLAQRVGMQDVPVASGYESGCMGWKAAPLELRNARVANAPVTAMVRKGDTLLLEFIDVDGWTFVEVLKGSTMVAMGWARVELNQKNCTNLAG